MRLLLDTHILLWSVTREDKLGRRAAELIQEVTNEKLFSAASIWEIAIKRSLGRPDFAVDPDDIASTARLDFIELPIWSDVAARVASLPLHHRDPFDRLLIAQAISEGALLLTVDVALAAYGDHVLLAT